MPAAVKEQHATQESQLRKTLQARGCSAARHSQQSPASTTPSSGKLYQTGSDRKKLSQEPACRHHTKVTRKRQSFIVTGRVKRKTFSAQKSPPKQGWDSRDPIVKEKDIENKA